MSVTPRVFGRIEINFERRQLRVDGATVTVGSRAFDVLWALADRSGRVVTKQELLGIAWEGLEVEENNLAVQISALRRLLGPGWIATVRGRGYRFVSPDVAALVPVAAASLARASVRRPTARMSRSDAPLYNRETELALLSDAIAASRLVTLTGIGGIGKSHLAQRLLADRACLGGADVAWAELAPLAGPQSVVATLATACGARYYEPDPLAGLVAALAQRKLLLGIDNAEHLIDEVVRVVQALLANAPSVHVLVASQTSLRIDQERIVRLGPLACAPADASPEQAMQYGAVELFVRRAQAADFRFKLQPNNVSRVVEICGRVGGLPLAIELVAARTPLLRLAGLTALLSDPLRLLASGQRSLDERHRTLRSTLAWSHDLLTNREKAAFRRMGVFAGSCSLEMARDVLVHTGHEVGEMHNTDGAPCLLDSDVAALDAIRELVVRSLVETDDSDPPRYRLLETTRAYAIERLEAAGETRAWRARHAHVVTANATSADDLLSAGLRTRDETVATLRLEIDNLRAALAWSLEQTPALALRLVSVIGGLLRDILFVEMNAMPKATRPFADDQLPMPMPAR